MDLDFFLKKKYFKYCKIKPIEIFILLYIIR